MIKYLDKIKVFKDYVDGVYIMKKVYDKLNYYLNDICNYLERKHQFLLENIDKICKLNDSSLKILESYSFDNQTIQNSLTYDEIYCLAREIVECIDKDYLESFDNLIQSGELDFSYENDYRDSQCVSTYKDGEAIRQIININREFNYNDVILLIHEFIHYTNGKKISKNRDFFTEFLSIYFEFYAIDYLLQKGINKEEIDYLDRIKNLKEHSTIFFQYEIVLLAYEKFGNLDENTVELLQQYFLDVEKETFEKECTTLQNNLCIAEEVNKDRIKKNPNESGHILAEEFMSYNYKYILGTFLALYARKYSNFNDVVNLNNHINELNDKTIYDICLSIGIDLNDENFVQKLFDSMKEYINAKQFESAKLIKKLN